MISRIDRRRAIIRQWHEIAPETKRKRPSESGIIDDFRITVNSRKFEMLIIQSPGRLNVNYQILNERLPRYLSWRRPNGRVRSKLSRRSLKFFCHEKEGLGSVQLEVDGEYPVKSNTGSTNSTDYRTCIRFSVPAYLCVPASFLFIDYAEFQPDIAFFIDIAYRIVSYDVSYNTFHVKVSRFKTLPEVKNAPVVLQSQFSKRYAMYI